MKDILGYMLLILYLKTCFSIDAHRVSFHFYYKYPYGLLHVAPKCGLFQLSSWILPMLALLYKYIFF